MTTPRTITFTATRLSHYADAGYARLKPSGEWRYFQSFEAAHAAFPGCEFYPIEVWEATFFPHDNQPDPPDREER